MVVVECCAEVDADEKRFYQHTGDQCSYLYTFVPLHDQLLSSGLTSISLLD